MYKKRNNAHKAEYLKKLRRFIIQKYSPSIQMIQYLQNACHGGIEQPGSLNQTYFYQFDKNKKYKFSKLLNHIYLILNSFFGTFYGLISKPVYLFTQNKLTIYINYYIPDFYYYKSKKLVTRNLWKYNKVPAKSAINLKLELTKLIKIISNLLNSSSMPLSMNALSSPALRAAGAGEAIPNGFEQPLSSASGPVGTEEGIGGVKVELQLNQLKYPYHDSTILSKFIALSTNRKRFRRIFNTIIKKALVITKDIIKDQKNKDFFIAETSRKKIKIHNTVPAVLTGLKVRISGRLITERQIPKRTVQQKEIGGFNRTKDSIVDYALYTNKNKRGTYSVKVWTTSKICI